MFMLNVDANSFYTCGDLNLSVAGLLINLVHLLYTLILVGVPILLVFFGMLDLGKAVMAQKEDEIKKGQQMFVKRLVAAVIVFLVFGIVQTVVSVVSNDSNITSCSKCFINADENACILVR